jgi:hypothetical protein
MRNVDIGSESIGCTISFSFTMDSMLQGLHVTTNLKELEPSKGADCSYPRFSEDGNSAELSG